MPNRTKKDRTPPDPRANIPDEYKPAAWLTKAPYRPPNSAHAAVNRDVLYAAVGRVLTQWELLETILAALFQSLVGSKKNSALRAYGSVLASGTRCDMLISAAEVELEGADFENFKTCILDVRKLASVRNLLAHGVVVALHQNSWISDNPRLANPGPFMITAAPYNSSKFKVGQDFSYLYSIGTIENVLDEIQKLMARVGDIDRKNGFHKLWAFELG